MAVKEKMVLFFSALGENILEGCEHITGVFTGTPTPAYTQKAIV